MQLEGGTSAEHVRDREGVMLGVNDITRGVSTRDEL